MADSSNIDFEKLVVAWEEEDLLNIMEWGGLPQKKMQDTEHCPESNKSYKMKQENFYRYAFLSCIEKTRFTGILV